MRKGIRRKDSQSPDFMGKFAFRPVKPKGGLMGHGIDGGLRATPDLKDYDTDDNKKISPGEFANVPPDRAAKALTDALKREKGEGAKTAVKKLTDAYIINHPQGIDIAVNKGIKAQLQRFGIPTYIADQLAFNCMEGFQDEKGNVILKNIAGFVRLSPHMSQSSLQKGIEYMQRLKSIDQSPELASSFDEVAKHLTGE